MAIWKEYDDRTATVGEMPDEVHKKAKNYVEKECD